MAVASVWDVVIDCLFDENVEGALQTLGVGRLLKSQEDPNDPYLLGEDGYLVVRVKDRDPHQFARELERRVSQMRVVTVIDRTPSAERK